MTRQTGAARGKWVIGYCPRFRPRFPPGFPVSGFLVPPGSTDSAARKTE
jgi:hypothetical protein